MKKIARYRVILKAPWIVNRVDSVESACNIAVAEAGKRVPNYVDVDVATAVCLNCGKRAKTVILVGDKAFVVLLLSIRVYADSEEGARRIARSVLGKYFDSTLEIVSVSRE